MINTLQNSVPSNHYLVQTIKTPKYKNTLERLVNPRNIATHSSERSKSPALKAIGQQRMSSCGAWLKKQSRLEGAMNRPKNLAMEVHKHAPC